MQMNEIVVWHEAGDRFRIAIRGHDLVVDQPTSEGGHDAGPTPTELFVASLASCVGYHAERFLARHGVEPSGLEVDCRWRLAEGRPARVEAVDLWLRLPAGFPDELRDRLSAVVAHCTVHNSITTPPAVNVRLDVPAPVG